MESGRLNHLVKDVKQIGKEGQKGSGPQKGKIINMVRGQVKDCKRKSMMTDEEWMNVPITFPRVLARDLSEEANKVEAEVEGGRLTKTQTMMSGFSGEQVKPLGKIKLDVCFGGDGLCRRAIMKFTVIPTPSPYNIILGRPCLKQLRAIPSTIHGGEEVGNGTSRKSEATKESGPDKGSTCQPSLPGPVGRGDLSPEGSAQLKALKRPVLSPEKSQTVTQKVAEWLKAGIVRPVRYPTWISNLVLVKKVDGSWRMCIDFKNINYACPKDYYPLPKIDMKIESVVRFPLKCFLDAYKGYHQVQMVEEDEEKTAFYTDQGTFCYTKMPFGLKNVGATKTEKKMIADVAETFDNIRRINMKLNPEKKCSFEVEGKERFWDTWSHRKAFGPIPPNKRHCGNAITQTWGQMQSLSGKLAALNRFLSRSAEKSLPFFETLKNITKENKDDYRWTEDAEMAFQELKKTVLNLPSLTTPVPKETLYVYLAASQEAVSAVLLAKRKGNQCPVHYVSRTLHDVERNYTPLEKLALALRHVSRRSRSYFKAHPIKVITDQPIKQILDKAKASGKLAKYCIELGAYDITYELHSSIKGQVLEDFINEVSVGSDALVPRRTPYTVDQQTVCKEEWVLHTDGASSIKGSGAGLVLMSPTKTEYTYAMRLNFTGTNNQAEYEALLAGLRIAKKMKVQSLSINVDSKLVASQINGSYEAFHETMVKYLAKAKENIGCFKNFKIRNIPRNQNHKADVLSKLASVAFNHLTKEILVEVL
ncbi:reverse transcriptase domain-containing protein [Tanacetum coccineum]